MTGFRRTISMYLAGSTVAMTISASFMLPTLTPARVLAQTTPAANATSNPDTTAPSIGFNAAANDTADLAAQLIDRSTTASVRDEAARRLAGRRTPEALRALLNSLQDPNANSQASVAQAIAEQASPDPAFITPLFAAMGTNPNVTERVVAALINYRGNGEVVTRLIDIAGNRQQRDLTIRSAAIHALGSFVEKRSADELMKIIRNSEENAQLRVRASDALAMLTGIVEFGSDATAWTHWWDVYTKKSDADFRTEMLERTAAQFDREKSHYARLGRELDTWLHEMYRNATDSRKEDLLLRFLKSNEPETRTAGVDQVNDDFSNARAIPASVTQYLRGMIGDSNPNVRQAVARTIQNTNDKAALDLFLAQLSRETDPQVRAFIAIALGPMGDVKAAEPLVKLLDDDSRLVAKNAAQSLTRLGPKIVQADAVRATVVATRLKAIIDRTTGSGGDADLRVACVAALVPLKQKAMSAMFYKLLDPRVEMPNVRISALRALGEIGDAESAGSIISALSDPDGSVVYAALQALASIQLAAQGDLPADLLNPLQKQLDPSVQRDDSIRKVAWGVLQNALPTLSKEQLTQWADFFGGIKDPSSQVLVLKTLADKLTAAGAFDDLATFKEQIGGCLMQLKDFDNAAVYYKQALEYWTDQKKKGLAVAGLKERYLNAKLQAAKYEDAVAFASDLIALDPGDQDIAGPAISSQIDSLRASGNIEDLRKAISLADLAIKMNPPLASKFVDRLKETKVLVQKQLDVASHPATGPRSDIETVASDWLDRIVLV